MSTIYRNAQESDVRQLSEMMILLDLDQSRFDHAMLNDKNKQFEYQEILKKLINKESYKLIVAEQDNQLIAYIFAWLQEERNDFTPCENCLYISDAFIIPKYRNSGHIERLFYLIQDWAYQKKCNYLLFEAYVDNKIILKIAEKLGFAAYKLKYLKNLTKNNKII